MANRKVDPSDFDLSIERVCNKCQENKTLNFFHIERTARYGRSTICIDCQRWRYLEYTYGITKSEFLNMLSEQDGKCAICQNILDLFGKICVDHDHSCCTRRPHCGNCNRGLLCDTCNVGLGKFKDDLSLLDSARAYLQSHAKENENLLMGPE